MKIDNFVLIIGAMKCGTTSLFHYLCQHPQISSPIFKEPNFFSYDERWHNGIEWYLSRWQNWNPKQHKIALEASVNYSKIQSYPKVISRIKTLKDHANFKFIYIVRDPIERIESHYTYDIAKRREKFETFSKAVDLELIETSKYAKQIEPYYNNFSKQDILLINFDDLKLNSEKTVKKVCQFLEIDPDYDFVELKKVYNSTKNQIVDIKIWQFLRPIKPLRKVSKIFSPQQKEKIRRLIGGKEINQNFKLSLAQKKYVLKELNEDLKKLSEKYGVDLSSWNIDIET
ncbi:MAG: sulfotransferase [Pleurocapsa sp.]